DMLGGLIDAVRRAGLQPEGIDLSAFGMIRALAHESYDPVASGDPVAEAEVAEPAGEAAQRLDAPSQDDPAPAASPAAASARLYCNLGDVTNLAVARGTACLFTRISPFGVEGIAQKLAERRQLTLEHSRQWLSHVGLASPIESVEGDPETRAAARDALTEGAARLVDELRLSLEYYAASEGAIPIDGIVACGPGTTIPGLVERLQHDLGQRFEIGRPKGLSHLDRPTAARLTMSFGLALEE
ncbi:MAG: hypothetical protein ACRDK1_02095, partial [Solirubrobacterales bacterium]